VAQEKKKSSLVGRLLKVLLVLVVLVALAVGGIYVYGTTLESKPHIERSIVIEADVDDIHSQVGDLRKWDDWGPWREQDPDMTYTYTDSTTEKGSKMSWDMKDGSGSVKFTKVDPEKGVEYIFTWENWTPTTGGVKYEPQGDGKVKVTWYFDADYSGDVLSRLFIKAGKGDMEKMFDKGLANLKNKVENPPES
jgi:hypothetical protein